MPCSPPACWTCWLPRPRHGLGRAATCTAVAATRTASLYLAGRCCCRTIAPPPGSRVSQSGRHRHLAASPPCTMPVLCLGPRWGKWRPGPHWNWGVAMSPTCALTTRPAAPPHTWPTVCTAPCLERSPSPTSLLSVSPFLPHIPSLYMAGLCTETSQAVWRAQATASARQAAAARRKAATTR